MSDDGRRYPVQIETSETYVVWVEADTAEEAVQQVRDDSEWYEHIQGASPVSTGVDTTEVDSWYWDAPEGVYHEPMGPLDQCRLCHAPCHSVRTPMNHTPDCSEQIARRTRYLAQNMDQTGRYRAFRALRVR